MCIVKIGNELACVGDEARGYFGQVIGCQRHYLERRKTFPHWSKFVTNEDSLSIQGRLKHIT
jgi:hypothetical protein